MFQYAADSGLSAAVPFPNAEMLGNEKQLPNLPG
jgi:hypothetical protein